MLGAQPLGLFAARRHVHEDIFLQAATDAGRPPFLFSLPAVVASFPTIADNDSDRLLFSNGSKRGSGARCLVKRSAVAAELMDAVGLLVLDEERVRLSAKREDFDREGRGACDLRMLEWGERGVAGPSRGVLKGDELGNGCRPAASR